MKKNRMVPKEISCKGKWSVKEEVGHLSDLEPLWLGRLDDLIHENGN